MRVPTLVAQVHDDTLTYPSDVQAIYDNIAAVDKKLHWIEGTDQRFRGYNYFGEHPEVAIEWFDAFLNYCALRSPRICRSHSTTAISHTASSLRKALIPRRGISEAPEP